VKIFKPIDIVGHRGAAGLAPENTIKSIKTALINNADAVEFDVRLTRDNKLILCHDNNLERVIGKKTRVKSLSYSEIKKLLTISGDPIPTLEEALEAIGSRIAIIELKDSDSLKPLLKVIDKYPTSNIRITSFKHIELMLLKKQMPGLFLYAAENTKPIEAIHNASLVKADGITLNFWLLNPLTYLFAKKRNLEIMVYTVNNRFMAWFIHVIYPGVAICTDFPDKIHQHGKKV